LPFGGNLGTSKGPEALVLPPKGLDPRGLDYFLGDISKLGRVGRLDFCL
jgi:hypothetical protein